jgi:uncharacterized protein (TIGR02246 family)
MKALSQPMIRLLLLAAAILTALRPVAAQPPANRSTDEAAIRQSSKDYIAAMDRRDTKALSDLWTAEGTFTDEGGRTTKARDMLASRGTSTGAAARPQINVSDVKIRFLTSDVAVEEGDCQTAQPGGQPAVKGHYAATWVRQAGRWRLDSLRETRSQAAVDSNRLASLDVFAGEWSGESDKATIHVSAKWDATKRFLRREITIKIAKASLGCNQEIGWDPVSQHIKSWSFLDDGSYGDGLWSLEGNAWMVLTSRVLPDGKTATATHVYKFPDKNTMVWKSIHGSIDGQLAADFEVTLKREGESK